MVPSGHYAAGEACAAALTLTSAGFCICSAGGALGGASACAPGAALPFASAASAPGVATGRLFLKHCRHSTGRPCVGLKGTVVSMPHSEQVVRVSVREMPAAAGPVPVAPATDRKSTRLNSSH